jgi:uncharacterized protein (TIGR02246 family)
METDEEQIRQLMEDWRRSTLEGDLDAALALMTHDAVFLTCGNAPMTKNDFANAFGQFAGKIRIDSTQEIKDLHASGDVGYAWSYISVVMTFLETGSKTERKGHVLTVFRKSPSGRWVLARDANLMTTDRAH